jgi:hypothetical protein
VSTIILFIILDLKLGIVIVSRRTAKMQSRVGSRRPHYVKGLIVLVFIRFALFLDLINELKCARKQE